MTKPRPRKQAQAIALSVEIFCPDDCGREDPIPARDGSFMWTELPAEVTCPTCKRTFRVKRTVIF